MALLFMCWMTPGKPFLCHCSSLMLFEKKITHSVLDSKKTLNTRWSRSILTGFGNIHKLMFLKLGCWVFLGGRKPKSNQKTNQIWVWSVEKGDLKLSYIFCGNTVPKKRRRCKCGLPDPLSQSQSHLMPPQFATRHFSPKADHEHLSPLLHQGDLLSYSMSVMVLFYSFSETAWCTKYFSFTSSQQETFSHILGCLMEIWSFAVFPIDSEVADLCWKSLWDRCWAIFVFCTPKFCSWCWQFHSSSRIELSSREVEITQHEMAPHLNDTEGELGHGEQII